MGANPELSLRIGPEADVDIPESATRFFSRQTDAQLTFIQDPAGQTTQLLLHQNRRDLTAPRLPWSTNARGL